MQPIMDIELVATIAILVVVSVVVSDGLKLLTRLLDWLIHGEPLFEEDGIPIRLCKKLVRAVAWVSYAALIYGASYLAFT